MFSSVGSGSGSGMGMYEWDGHVRVGWACTSGMGMYVEVCGRWGRENEGKVLV